MPNAENKLTDEQRSPLIRLADLDPIQQQLDALRVRLSVVESGGNVTDAELARVVREVIRSRKRRGEFFQQELFGEPAWDILLELYAASLARRKTSISGACHMSGVPPTTALRWIGRLEELGLVQRSADQVDNRRFWLSLTPRTRTALRAYFATMLLTPK